MTERKKLVFLTGTRADLGKLKSLIDITRNDEAFEVHIFATGMHMDRKYGFTVNELEKYGYSNVYRYINHDSGASMDITLSRTIEGFANYIKVIEPDLIVVHGDRVEALAGATVGALNNILVAHIEGGELSGTVDELIRHAVSKLSHIHFVANSEAKARLQQMGECPGSIFVIGSPDMDAMQNDTLPLWHEVQARYEIPFDEYFISMFHPVTTEFNNMDAYALQYMQALEQCGENIVAIYPNNDKGSDFILNHLLRLAGHPRFRIFPSVRFEAFLVLMKHSLGVVGNSSAGIREAPFYGIPTVNVGTRQNGRTRNPDILHTSYEPAEIVAAIRQARHHAISPQVLFGDGTSGQKFREILGHSSVWNISRQKTFTDTTVIA